MIQIALYDVAKYEACLKAGVAYSRLRGGHPKNFVTNLSSGKIFSVLQVVQTSCGVHSDSYSVDWLCAFPSLKRCIQINLHYPIVFVLCTGKILILFTLHFFCNQQFHCFYLFLSEFLSDINRFINLHLIDTYVYCYERKLSYHVFTFLCFLVAVFTTGILAVYKFMCNSRIKKNKLMKQDS
jgi:hypothetical protein